MIFIAVLLTLLYSCNAVEVNPLPVLRNVSWGNEGPMRIDLDLHFQLTKDCAIVSDSIQRTLKTIKKVKWQPASIEVPFDPNGKEQPLQFEKNVPCISKMKVKIEDTDAELQLGMDESYSLIIDRLSKEVVIEAATPWGALHAVTTLQQLIVYGEDTKQFYIEDSIEISDSPKYPHRGIMIDAARNFMTVDSILEQVDIMALCKMNSLHWHLTDSQSWPVEIKAYPHMTKDAYSKKETYSHEDIKHVVEYARSRGVRVIPEVDMPAHSGAGWNQIDHELNSCYNKWWNNGTALEPPSGQLDIAYDKTYEVVEKVYEELSTLFGDNVFHVGADEVVVGCYNYSQNINDWFKRNSSLTYDDLMQYWVDKTTPIFLNNHKRRLTMWEDIVTGEISATNVSKDVILQCWSDGENTVKDLASMGYDLILSSASHLYLDCGYGGFVPNDPRYLDNPKNVEFNTGNGGSWCSPYKTWQRMYDFDLVANLTSKEQKHILGAEAPLWAEQVDHVVLTQKIWPRTAALAELTWSGNRDPDSGEITTKLLGQRIINFREYLVALGYNASPLVPKYCVQHPHACDLTYD